MGDAVAHRKTLRAHPGHEALVALKKRDVVARAVARCGDGQRLQMPLAHQVRDALQRHQLVQQFAQWCVVQQRAWLDAPPLGQQPTYREQCEPSRTGAQHAQVVGAVDLLGAEVAPGVGNHAHRGVKVVGTAGQRGGVDGTGGGACNDGEGVGLVTRATGQADVGNGFEHAHLVGRAGATTGQQQASGGRGWWGLVHGSIMKSRPGL